MRFTTEDPLTTRAGLSHDLDPGELGEGDREAGHVLGRTRTMILVRLNNACTTTGLAEGLSMSPATASRQVGLPRRAGFVLSVRKGRSTVYMLSPYGRSIVEA